MVKWNNLDTLDSYKSLASKKGSVNLVDVMSGEKRSR